MKTILDYVNENKGFFNEVLAQLRVLLFYHVSEKHHVETSIAFCCELYICLHPIFSLLGEIKEPSKKPHLLNLIFPIPISSLICTQVSL